MGRERDRIAKPEVHIGWYENAHSQKCGWRCATKDNFPYLTHT